jgi:dUTP pyrophosphatase
MSELQYYKIHEDVIDPTYATEFSACFDIRSYLKTGQKIRTYTPSNKEILVGVTDDSVSIKPGDRMLIPTGLIFKIPQDYSVRIHIRSSVAFKQGIFLANSEGVIDSDYFHEGFLMVINSSSQSVTIKNGDRIAQGELVQKISNALTQCFEKPEQVTDRIGGIGSTGR